MYKVLVVDDEKNIRERLMTSFAWKDLGYEVIGCVENGVEAWSIIVKETPHVVLTDILMPKMDGLELTKHIHNLYPGIKVVILSAYDDFSYAKDAIKYGVRGYLLKPLIIEEFEELFYKLKNELTESEQGVNRNNIKESLLIDLLKGNNIDNSNTRLLLESLNLSCLNNYIRIVIYSFEQVLKKDSRLTLQQIILNKSFDYWKKYGVPVVSYSSEIILFANDIKPISKITLKKELEEFKRSIRYELEGYAGASVEITIAVGNLYNNLEKVCQSYNEAIYACSHKYFNGLDSIIFYQDLNHTGKVSRVSGEDEVNKASENLINSIFSDEVNDVLRSTQTFFGILEEAGCYTAKDIQLKCEEILLTISLNLKAKGINIFNLNKSEIFESIRAITTLNGLKYWLIQRLNIITMEIKEAKSNDLSSYVAIAKDYVEKNYAKKITLEAVSEHLHINSAYFSNIFKKATGQNFIDYLNEIRIKKASELIKNTDYQIKEISIMVGYNNFSYFNKLFKKITGVRPLIYRAGILQTLGVNKKDEFMYYSKD